MFHSKVIPQLLRSTTTEVTFRAGMFEFKYLVVGDSRFLNASNHMSEHMRRNSLAGQDSVADNTYLLIFWDMFILFFFVNFDMNIDFLWTFKLFEADWT